MPITLPKSYGFKLREIADDSDTDAVEHDVDCQQEVKRMTWFGLKVRSSLLSACSPQLMGYIGEKQTSRRERANAVHALFSTESLHNQEPGRD